MQMMPVRFNASPLWLRVESMSGRFHRCFMPMWMQRLKLLDRQRLFNYFLARRAFVCTYTSRMRQMNEEAAESRGTSLEAVQQTLGPKYQLKGIDIPES